MRKPDRSIHCYRSSGYLGGCLGPLSSVTYDMEASDPFGKQNRVVRYLWAGCLVSGLPYKGV